ncbi:NUDIX domain-containing protein [bacterium]|nr:NUDIX domain-containing protein [bacterium]
MIAIIRNREDQILFTRRRFEPHIGKLDLPGGFVDFDETLEEALQREIKEELNIEVQELTYYGSFSTKYPYKQVIYQPLDAVFECSIKSWDGLKPCDDVAEICFRSPWEITFEELAFSSNCLILENLRKMKHRSNS